MKKHKWCCTWKPDIPTGPSYIVVLSHFYVNPREKECKKAENPEYILITQLNIGCFAKMKIVKNRWMKRKRENKRYGGKTVKPRVGKAVDCYTSVTLWWKCATAPARTWKAAVHCNDIKQEAHCPNEREVDITASKWWEMCANCE